MTKSSNQTVWLETVRMTWGQLDLPSCKCLIPCVWWYLCLPRRSDPSDTQSSSQSSGPASSFLGRTVTKGEYLKEEAPLSHHLHYTRAFQWHQLQTGHAGPAHALCKPLLWKTHIPLVFPRVLGALPQPKQPKRWMQERPHPSLAAKGNSLTLSTCCFVGSVSKFHRRLNPLCVVSHAGCSGAT